MAECPPKKPLKFRTLDSSLDIHKGLRAMESGSIVSIALQHLTVFCLGRVPAFVYKVILFVVVLDFFR